LILGCTPAEVFRNRFNVRNQINLRRSKIRHEYGKQSLVELKKLVNKGEKGETEEISPKEFLKVLNLQVEVI
jgi:hypothetical protein